MSTVNPQITDAVTQSNVQVVGSAPATAIASLCQVSSHAVSLALQNAVSQQQALNIIGNATVASAVQQILAVGGRS
ncbi:MULTISPECIES: RebB family R body protein [Pseudomonas]|uniref:Killing trait n=1 Tax=Pseudomonas asplenii TaxID=53407 RepID=A0A0N0E5A4_9PSED|nr:MULTISPECIES: RebB family R body protein [Pseudomonas]KPA92189.1 Killing trait [Pseudomonas fuscovaginae]KPA97665.1 Killing trait [Pseudomonas fuscovaginae]